MRLIVGPSARPSVAAGFAYFGATFLVGFVLGVARTLLLEPLVGEALAVTIEIPFILGFSWLVCRWLIRKMRVGSAVLDRATMGVAAFVLLMASEFAISVCFAGRDLAGHLALYQEAPNLLGLAGQIAFALFPVVQLRGGQAGD